MIGIDAQFLGNGCLRSARFAAKQVADLLTLQPLRFLECFDGAVPLTQHRLHVLAMKCGGSHAP